MGSGEADWDWEELIYGLSKYFEVGYGSIFPSEMSTAKWDLIKFMK